MYSFVLFSSVDSPCYVSRSSLRAMQIGTDCNLYNSLPGQSCCVPVTDEETEAKIVSGVSLATLPWEFQS